MLNVNNLLASNVISKILRASSSATKLKLLFSS